MPQRTNFHQEPGIEGKGDHEGTVGAGGFYAGRLHRLHSDKQEVWIFDYVDEEVPTLRKMFQKRATGYRSLGYQEGTPPDEFEILCDPSWEAELYWDAAEVAQ